MKSTMNAPVPCDDSLARREPREREYDNFRRLPEFLAEVRKGAPGLDRWLGAIETAELVDRSALAKVPVLRKDTLMRMQEQDPPFGGFTNYASLMGQRIFLSPGPIFEPQGLGTDPWQAGRALIAAGVRQGDLVHNAFSHHMTPGGFIMDEGARAIGCMVFPAGVGNTKMQVEAAAALRPTVYCGTPDFLKVLLETADQNGLDLTSFTRGLVSGGALFASLREEYLSRGISVLQAYATADLGVIAYESLDDDGNVNPGMIVNENLIVEIVRPGTDDPVPEGEVGELVVTTFNAAYPLLRFGTGDLSAVLPGRAPCGRTNTRLQGWLGRADQRTKVKGMFVDPRQIATLLKRHPEIDKARLVISRKSDQDNMHLLAVPSSGARVDISLIEESLREITKLGGTAAIASPTDLPNDGRIIVDERDYSA